MISKKGAEKIFSIYWFAILIIVATAIVISVMVFYSSAIDVRDLEGEIITNKIIDCISVGGVLNEEAKQGDFDLVKDCNFNFKDDDFEEGQYYAYFVVYEFDDNKENGKGEGLNLIEYGRSDFLEICDRDKNFPQCFKQNVFLVDKDKNQFIVEVFGGVRKTEKNVKA